MCDHQQPLTYLAGCGLDRAVDVLGDAMPLDVDEDGHPAHQGVGDIMELGSHVVQAVDDVPEYTAVVS